MQVTSSAQVGTQKEAPEKIPGGNARQPDGRIIDAVKPWELHRILVGCGINISAELGKVELAAHYVRHISEIYDTAGRAAVEAWREQHRPKAVL